MSDETRETQWLQRLVGEWTYEGEATGMGMGEGFAGTERVRRHGAWVVGEATGQGSNGEPDNINALCFDPAKGKVVGTFISGMMPFLWVYEGQLTADGAAVELSTSGPSFEDETKSAPYVDTIRFDDDDHRTLTSRYRGSDGEWHLFMTQRFTRVSTAGS